MKKYNLLISCINEGIRVLTNAICNRERIYLNFYYIKDEERFCFLNWYTDKRPDTRLLYLGTMKPEDDTHTNFRRWDFNQVHEHFKKFYNHVHCDMSKELKEYWNKSKKKVL